MKTFIRKILLSCMMVIWCLGLLPLHTLAAKAPTASFTNYYVGASNQGFVPGNGKKLVIKTSYKLKKKNYPGICRVRLRILNKDGKYVYQKLWTIKKSGSKTVYWDGTASAGNKAGVLVGAYAEAGFYKAEVAVRYQLTDTTGWKSAAKQSRVFMIAGSGSGDGSTAGAGSGSGDGSTAGTGSGSGDGSTAGAENGSSDTAKIPIYTGNKYIDYIAEQMIIEAGIKEEMTDDEKVKLIYHYMTTHFHHVHYNKANSYKVYYKTTTKLKDAVTAYGKQMKKWKKAGKIQYESVSSGILWNMKRRIGECNHHALIFQILCKHIGVEAATCKGYYLNMNGTRAGHYWNSAVIDGKTYYYDVDVEIQNYGKGQGDYYWYKKTLKEAKKTHAFVSYDVY